MSDIERQCKFLREFFKDIDVDGGKLQLKLENCAVSLEKQEAELSQLRQLCREMYKLWHWRECINTNCDNNGTITALGANGDPYPVHCEYCYRRSAAIEKYNSMVSK